MGTRRVALVVRAPLLRRGIELLLHDAGVTVVVAVASRAEFEQLGVPPDEIDAVVVHLERAPGDDSPLPAWSGTHIVGLHDGLPSRDVRSWLATGVGVLVDTSSAPALLVDAIRQPGSRTLLRWDRPGIAPMPLTPRERSVLTLVAAGMTSRDVAAALAIGTQAVERHKRRIFDRLGVANQAQAVAVAIRLGYLDPAPAVAGGVG